MYYYILVRHWLSADEYKIVGVPKDCNPLFGNGSWNQFDGPFFTWEAAEEKVAEVMARHEAAVA